MRAVVVLLLGLSLLACGSALPEGRQSAALHRDLTRLVELADTEGWSIDRIEVEEAISPALMSVCRTPQTARMELLAWLDQELSRRGGTIEEIYEKRGRDLSEISEELTLSRVRMLLARSLELVNEDCPFWLRPDSNFRGRQILDDRWILSTGGGGKGMVVSQAGSSDLHFGGAGRLLVGRGFGHHATWFTGLEVGGSAALPRGENTVETGLEIAVDAVVPIIYRHRLINAYWELEAGYLAHTTEKELETSHGFHLGASIGGSASRRRWLFPGAAFGVSYEYVAEDEAPLHMFKLGFRVALDLAR